MCEEFPVALAHVTVKELVGIIECVGEVILCFSSPLSNGGRFALLHSHVHNFDAHIISLPPEKQWNTGHNGTFPPSPSSFFTSFAN